MFCICWPRKNMGEVSFLLQTQCILRNFTGVCFEMLLYFLFQNWYAIQQMVLTQTVLTYAFPLKVPWEVLKSFFTLWCGQRLLIKVPIYYDICGVFCHFFSTYDVSNVVEFFLIKKIYFDIEDQSSKNPGWYVTVCYGYLTFYLSLSLIATTYKLDHSVRYFICGDSLGGATLTYSFSQRLWAGKVFSKRVFRFTASSAGGGC